MRPYSQKSPESVAAALPPMTVSSLRAFRISASLGFLGVALGAFGAHGLKAVFSHRPGAELWWEKAVLYHFVHTGAMLILSCLEPFPVLAWSLFGAGILCFSGSLYLLALTGAHWLVYLTPVGGLLFLAGWFWLAFAHGRARRAPEGNHEHPTPHR